MSKAEKDLNDLKNRIDVGLTISFQKLLKEKKASDGILGFLKTGIL